MIFTAALWLAALIHEQKVKQCVFKEPLPLAWTCQPPGVASDPETCVALPAPNECEEFHCPEYPAGCQIATPKPVRRGTCPKRCDVVQYPPGTMSRNWESIVREMFSSLNAEGHLQIALENGILVSARNSFNGEAFEISSSQFSPPPGDYVILFQDPVTCNVIARDHMILEPKRE